MDFEEYRRQFEISAKENKLEPARVEELLDYARQLNEKNLPIIYDQQHLCLLMGIDSDYVYRACNKISVFYRKFQIDKKNGKKRTIYEPLPTLKRAQYFILEHILGNLESSVYSKAFKKKISIKDNVKFHKKQKYVLNMDIEDYFGSISWYKVYQMFLKCGYNDSVSMLMTKLCTLNGALPQGAPTSPQLSNILTYSLDVQLADLAKQYNVRYTRYADDITISGDFKTKEMIKKVTDILYKEGFKVNKDKTRVASQANRQVVTGVVVNQKAQLDKQKRKEIRQNVYYIEKYGLEDHMKKIGYKDSPEKYLQSLLGVIGYASFINPKDDELIKYKIRIKNMLSELRRS